MQIRKAQPEDLAAVQALSAELFVYEQQRDPLLKMDWPLTEGKPYFESRINGDGVCFVAEMDGLVVGYLVGSIEEQPLEWRPIRRAEAENMCIKEEYRRHGLGGQLMQAFFAWAKEQGVTKVFTSVYAENEPSLKFHRKMGFKDYAMELEADLNE